MSINVVERVDDLVKVQNILVSVSDKSGLEQFIPNLVDINPRIQIYSTGGTFGRIREILGDSADRCQPLDAGITIHGSARDPGRSGQNPGL